MTRPMPAAQDELTSWRDALQRHVAALDSELQRVFTCACCESTQDEIRTHGFRPGDVVIAIDQTAGRGQRGSSWHDAPGANIALSFCIADEPADHLLSIRCAIAIARVSESLGVRDVQIKWPNDIVIGRRKLAGVLIERADGCAIVGIGINVGKRTWPDELRDRAVALHELGCHVDRLTVILSLLTAWESVEHLAADALQQDFADRDALTHTDATFFHNNQTFTGHVLAIDPMTAIRLLTADGERVLPAAATRCENWYIR